MVVKTVTETKEQCRAKNPATCRYHGQSYNLIKKFLPRVLGKNPDPQLFTHKPGGVFDHSNYYNTTNPNNKRVFTFNPSETHKVFNSLETLDNGGVHIITLDSPSVTDPKLGTQIFEVKAPEDGRPVVIENKAGVANFDIQQGNVLFIAESPTNRVYVGKNAQAIIITKSNRDLTVHVEEGGKATIIPSSKITGTATGKGEINVSHAIYPHEFKVNNQPAFTQPITAPRGPGGVTLQDVKDKRYNAEQKLEQYILNGDKKKAAEQQFVVDVWKMKEELAQNNFKSTFPALFDTDGNLVKAKYIRTRLKEAWALLDDEDQIVAWFNESRATDPNVRKLNDSKKGYYVGAVEAPAWVSVKQPTGEQRQPKAVVFRTDNGFSANVTIVDNGR